VLKRPYKIYVLECLETENIVSTSNLYRFEMKNFHQTISTFILQMNHLRNSIKKLNYLIVLIGCFLCFACEPTSNVKGKVIHVKDGDSIVVLDSLNEKLDVRLAFIDAPERYQAFGQQSKKHLTDLVLNKQVEIVVIEPTDRYGRIIAEINLANKTNVNKAMLASGMAWHYDKYPGTAQHERLERQAQKQNLGLWYDKNPTPPWEFRRK
jgi:endonuclease YncB( thermonuclease family)